MTEIVLQQYKPGAPDLLDFGTQFGCCGSWQNYVFRRHGDSGGSHKTGLRPDGILVH